MDTNSFDKAVRNLIFVCVKVSPVNTSLNNYVKVYENTKPINHVKLFKNLKINGDHTWINSNVYIGYPEKNCAIPLTEIYNQAMNMYNEALESNERCPKELNNYDPKLLYPHLLLLYTYQCLMYIEPENKLYEKLVNEMNNKINSIKGSNSNISIPDAVNNIIANPETNKIVSDLVKNINLDELNATINRVFKSAKDNEGLKQILDNTIKSVNPNLNLDTVVDLIKKKDIE
jgi:hypothetical protein